MAEEEVTSPSRCARSAAASGMIYCCQHYEQLWHRSDNDSLVALRSALFRSSSRALLFKLQVPLVVF
jgi:hypothetical protein